MKTVTVTIKPDGTSSIDVDGVKGSSCTNVTDALINAMGGTVLKDDKKPEFYQTTRENDKQKGGW